MPLYISRVIKSLLYMVFFSGKYSGRPEMCEVSRMVLEKYIPSTIGQSRDMLWGTALFCCCFLCSVHNPLWKVLKTFHYSFTVVLIMVGCSSGLWQHPSQQVHLFQLLWELASLKVLPPPDSPLAMQILAKQESWLMTNVTSTSAGAESTRCTESTRCIEGNTQGVLKAMQSVSQARKW